MGNKNRTRKTGKKTDETKKRTGKQTKKNKRLTNGRNQRTRTEKKNKKKHKNGLGRKIKTKKRLKNVQSTPIRRFPSSRASHRLLSSASLCLPSPGLQLSEHVYGRRSVRRPQLPTSRSTGWGLGLVDMMAHRCEPAWLHLQRCCTAQVRRADTSELHPASTTSLIKDSSLQLQLQAKVRKYYSVTTKYSYIL